MFVKPKNWVNGVVIVALLGLAFTGGYLKGLNANYSCDSPYIKIGNSCCLDRNHNTICDNDETEKELLDTCLKQNVDSCIKENVAGKCTTDLDCIEKSNRYCGPALEECSYLTEKNCKFGPLGAVCN